MSAPIRFLVLLVAGWAGVRAASLGMIPGIDTGYAKSLPWAEAKPPAVGEVPLATEFPPLPPVDAAYAQQWTEQQQWAEQQPMPYPPALAPAMAAVPVPARVPAAYYAYPYMLPAAAPREPIPPRPEWQLPSSDPVESPAFYTPIEPIEKWEVAELEALPQARSSPVPQLVTQPPGKTRLDRLQLSSWALLRGAPQPDALANGGTLGGSQAGARLLYAFNRWAAASLRTTSSVGGSRGAEVAGGIRITPLRSIPFAITAERRQAISPHGGGRSAFALFVEGGLYRRPMPLDFNLDAYVQAGIVGLKSRDYFADGALAFTRPIWGRFSAGFGVWGGIQPGLYRIDAGPRISMRIRDNIHVHADWRQRLVGNAEPASGPALTLAADF